MMHLKGVPYEVVEEPLRAWTKWLQEWAEKNGERPRVPLLRIVAEDGSETVIPESDDINIFLDTHHGSREYIPDEGTGEYQEMQTWLAWCADELKPMIDLYKYGEQLQFDPEKHIAHTAALRQRVEKLELQLTGHSFLVDERLTLADIAVIPFIRQIMRTREGEFDFTDFPKVEAWTRALIETEWFKEEVMKKYPLAPEGE